jgi:hypothetical protein
MSHSERLPECEAFQCNMKSAIEEHFKESIPVRRDVDVGKSQIITLEKAHEATMQDIRDIKESIIRLERTVLYSAISGLMVLVGVSLWLGGDKRQVEINTQRLSIIEEMHPRVGK